MKILLANASIAIFYLTHTRGIDKHEYMNLNCCIIYILIFIYFSQIICSVCSTLVLCCEKCVEDRPQNKLHEYHCVKHRDLKDVYFKVIERFTIEELQEQKNGLEKMAEKALNLLKKERT